MVARTSLRDRPFATAGEARELKLVNRIVPAANLANESVTVATDLASRPSVALASLKRACRHNRFVTYKQVPAFSLESSTPLQMNLDGEPYRDTKFQFEVMPQVLPFVLGPDAPLKASDEA
jgi:diacylglycerol kinase family enzyme